jgi:glycosyltransferase involved in cell wall biosynthesis
MTDLAVLGQDPGFGGGTLAMTESFWRAAESLGRRPELQYIRYRALDERRASGSMLGGRSVPQLLRGLDAANVAGAAAVIAPRLRAARSRFVCSAVASNGLAAVLARRRYGCWIATSLMHEWQSRSEGLDSRRRALFRANAPALRLYERTVVRNATVIWAISPATRSDLAETAGIAEERIRVVSIPIDLDAYVPLDDDEWRARLDEPEIVFVGRASDPRKNIGLLLDAFRLLRARLGREVRLTLVGEPPLMSLPPGVHATGHVGSVAELIRGAALFVLPSRQEGFGIVVAEALASGVPAVVTPSGGPEELIRASGGGEVLSGFEADELAQRVEALLSDQDTLVTMRRRGHAYVVREHDPAHLRAALRSALEELRDG